MLTLGQVVTTASIAAMSNILVFRLFILESIKKHLNHDFVAIYNEDHNSNMKAIQDGGRVFSMYLIQEELRLAQEKIYIITEADRSYTMTLILMKTRLFN